jgi:hypothetical protein
MTDTSNTDDTDLARPQDQEPAEGSRETVDEQLDDNGTTGGGAGDASMGGTSDGDTSG